MAKAALASGASKGITADPRCWSSETLIMRSMIIALALGFLVMWLLFQWVFRFHEPDQPAGLHALVISMAPFNTVALGLWLWLKIVSPSCRPPQLTVVTFTTSGVMMMFWLGCFFICFILAIYFAGKTDIWPHNTVLMDNKNGIRVHTFNELKNAQRATLSSAAISLCVFALWGLIANYRLRDIRAAQATDQQLLQDDVVRSDPSEPLSGDNAV
eukprot:c2049_g1_i1.p1 GENE.c2049_g1_i1~~c2049_g1_i1.p1  ORF type:complete len:227 (-),score=31.79 c2049_g1_i1:87-728(-)